MAILFTESFHYSAFFNPVLGAVWPFLALVPLEPIRQNRHLHLCTESVKVYPVYILPVCLFVFSGFCISHPLFQNIPWNFPPLYLFLAMYPMNCHYILMSYVNLYYSVLSQKHHRSLIALLFTYSAYGIELENTKSHYNIS